MAKNNGLPRHLLVMRTSAMGDVAMLPHALRALRAAYPGLQITVATPAMFRPFFRGLDVGFVDVRTRDEHHTLRGMWRLAAEVRRLGVDAVADVHDVLRSKAFRLSMRLHERRRERLGLDHLMYYDENVYFPEGSPAPSGAFTASLASACGSFVSLERSTSFSLRSLCE